jgi:hypothetical protein
MHYRRRSKTQSRIMEGIGTALLITVGLPVVLIGGTLSVLGTLTTRAVECIPAFSIRRRKVYPY